MTPGVSWIVLKVLPIIMVVESRGAKPDAQGRIWGDNGKAAGVYQLHVGAVEDVNRRYHTRFRTEDRHDIRRATDIAHKYLSLLAERMIRDGRQVNPMDLACAYNCGYDGWFNGDAQEKGKAYWAKCVKASKGRG